MKKEQMKERAQNVVLPCIIFAAVTGMVTGAVVFAFRVISEGIIEISHYLYGLAHDKVYFIPVIIAGAVLAAWLVSLCLTYSPHSRGGGIPTAVALMRGLITFHWLRNIIFVFTSALLSYLCGIPLGNDEGPAVQMGAAIGSGTTHIFGKKHMAWERYLMTGGATAGFATATCAPVTAVLFGLEEGHRRFSPLLIMTCISSVLAGMGTLELFCHLFGKSSALFHFAITARLPLSKIWAVVPLGLLCGVFAYFFGELTHFLRGKMHKYLKNLHPFFKVAPVFAVIAIVGCVYYEAIGTGHHLIEELLHHRMAWYSALILLAVRSLLVILSNDVGATGGLFTPILSFGALIGSAFAEALIALGIFDESYLMLLVVVGMVAFFAAAVRTPLTAMAFAVEALSGFGNLLPILLAVLVAYAIVEIVEANSINEIAMEREIHNERRGQTRHVVDVTMEAMHGSFAIGKPPRDILWPPSCSVLSVRQDNDKHFYTGGPIEAGDVLRLNFTTYDPARTAQELCAILGEQEVYDEDVIHHEIHETRPKD